MKVERDLFLPHILLSANPMSPNKDFIVHTTKEIDMDRVDWILLRQTMQADLFKMVKGPLDDFK
jgi:hypothetical protein